MWNKILQIFDTIISSIRAKTIELKIWHDYNYVNLQIVNVNLYITIWKLQEINMVNPLST